ncbi:MAG: hypothetical protein NTY70_06090, partial [Burkholderiales bacterium]|nr:hypothetical protein [Burkholderiales bacterium]
QLRTVAYSNYAPRQGAYSIRFFKHIGLRAAWNMRAGAAWFEISYGVIDGIKTESRLHQVAIKIAAPGPS